MGATLKLEHPYLHSDVLGGTSMVSTPSHGEGSRGAGRWLSDRARRADSPRPPQDSTTSPHQSPYSLCGNSSDVAQRCAAREGGWGLGNMRPSRSASRPPGGLSVAPHCFSLQQTPLVYISLTLSSSCWLVSTSDFPPNRAGVSRGPAR